MPVPSNYLPVPKARTRSAQLNKTESLAETLPASLLVVEWAKGSSLHFLGTEVLAELASLPSAGTSFSSITQRINAL